MEYNASTSPNLTLAEINDKIVLILQPVIILVVICIIISVVGNGLICYIFYRKMAKRAQHFLIVCLAVFDLISGTVVMPIEIVDMKQYYTFESEIACKMFRFVNACTDVSSILLLLVIAADRYKSVLHPFFPQMTIRSARLLLLLVIFGSLLISWPSYILFGIRRVDVGIPNVLGRDCTTDDSFRRTAFPLIYNGLQLAGFTVISASLVVVYVRIFKETRRHFKYIKKTTDIHRLSGCIDGPHSKSSISLISTSQTCLDNCYLEEIGRGCQKSEQSVCGVKNYHEVPPLYDFAENDIERQQKQLTHSQMCLNCSKNNFITKVVNGSLPIHDIVGMCECDSKYSQGNHHESYANTLNLAGTLMNSSSSSTYTSLKSVQTARNDNTKMHLSEGGGQDWNKNRSSLAEFSQLFLGSVDNNIIEDEDALVLSETFCSHNQTHHTAGKHKIFERSTPINIHNTNQWSRHSARGIMSLNTANSFTNQIQQTTYLNCKDQRSTFSTNITTKEAECNDPDFSSLADCTKCTLKDGATIVQHSKTEQLVKEPAVTQPSTTNESTNKGIIVPVKIGRSDTQKPMLYKNEPFQICITDENIQRSLPANVVNMKNETRFTNEVSVLSKSDSFLALHNVVLSPSTYAAQEAHTSQLIPQQGIASSSIKTPPHSLNSGNVIPKHAGSNKLNCRSSIRKSGSYPKNSRTTTLIAVTATTVFIVSFLPHLCLMLIRFLKPSLYDNLSDSGFILYNLFVRSYLANSVLNPIIYGCFNRKFRHQCYQILRKIFFTISC